MCLYQFTLEGGDVAEHRRRKSAAGLLSDSHNAAVTAGIGSANEDLTAPVSVQNNLPSAEGPVVIASGKRVQNREAVAFFPKRVERFRPEVGFHVKVKSAVPAETGSVKRILRAHMKIDQVHDHLKVALRLHEPAHDSEGADRSSVFHQEPGDDGLVGAFVRTGAVYVPGFQCKGCAPGLQDKPVFRNGDGGTKGL